MKTLVCVKRVPMTGGRIVLTEDEQAIETKHLGFAISPHEECGVEEAVRLWEHHGGDTVVLTLGPADAQEQLRDSMAIGIARGIHLVTDGEEWDPEATAAAIVEAVRADEAASGPFDLILFGNESADSGGFQIGLRVAYALDGRVRPGSRASAPTAESLGASRRREAAATSTSCRSPRLSRCSRGSTCRATHRFPGGCGQGRSRSTCQPLNGPHLASNARVSWCPKASRSRPRCSATAPMRPRPSSICSSRSEWHRESRSRRARRRCGHRGLVAGADARGRSRWRHTRARDRAWRRGCGGERSCRGGSCRRARRP